MSTPPPSGVDLVFYDGHCGLCHSGVRFLMKRDAEGSRFVYAPLHGATFESRLSPEQRAGLPDSIAVLSPDGRLRVRSEAAVYLAKRLGGGWAVVGRVGGWLPRGVRDAAYVSVARCRHKIFGRPKNACPVPTAEQRGRFLP